MLMVFRFDSHFGFEGMTRLHGILEHDAWYWQTI